MGHFTVTYDITTEDSAEQGDYAESGFASYGGWKHDDRPEPVSLREALQTCGLSYSRKYGSGFEDGGRAFYTCEADQNYRTGEETRYAIHPPSNITPASYRRVKRILTGK